MADIWFSSDWHFDHANIIKFCNRPFTSTDEMNEAIIERHNKLVKPQDHYYHLGDVTMIRGGQAQQDRLKGWISRLNGHGRLIFGNHDHFEALAYIRAGFEKVMAMQMFDNLRFTHIPIHPTSMGMAAGNVHGHIHNQDSPEPVLQVRDGKVLVKPYINISCEMTNYEPVHLDTIKEMVRRVVDACNSNPHPATEATVNKFNLSTQHCEICAEQSQRMQYYRCPEHAAN